MQRRKPQTIRIAVIEWHDHCFVHTDIGGYEMVDDALEAIAEAPIAYHSAGIFVGEDRDKVILSNVTPVEKSDMLIPLKSLVTLSCIVKGAIKRMVLVEVDLQSGDVRVLSKRGRAR